MTEHAHGAEETTPPEPKTPMWLPALGAVLFLLVGIWWATSTAHGARAGDAEGQGATNVGAPDAGGH